MTRTESHILLTTNEESIILGEQKCYNQFSHTFDTNLSSAHMYAKYISITMQRSGLFNVHACTQYRRDSWDNLEIPERIISLLENNPL